MEHLCSEIKNKNWNVAGVIQCTTVLKVIHTNIQFCQRHN
jgi:hypothetical protein